MRLRKLLLAATTIVLVLASVKLISDPASSLFALLTSADGFRPTLPFTKFAIGIVEYRRAESRMEFDGQCEWVVSVDEYNRLWVCVSKPSSLVPTVSVHGLWFRQSGELVRGFEVVTSTGNWTGVPGQFLARIRNRYPSDSGTLPEKPPQFSAEQVNLLLNALHQPANE